jgi:hypothetical protein
MECRPAVSLRVSQMMHKRNSMYARWFGQCLVSIWTEAARLLCRQDDPRAYYKNHTRRLRVFPQCN